MRFWIIFLVRAPIFSLWLINSRRNGVSKKQFTPSEPLKGGSVFHMKIQCFAKKKIGKLICVQNSKICVKWTGWRWTFTGNLLVHTVNLNVLRIVWKVILVICVCVFYNFLLLMNYESMHCNYCPHNSYICDNLFSYKLLTYNTIWEQPS